MKFIGVDLAWTYKNETGLCVINEQQQVEYLQANSYSDDELIAFIETYDDAIVSVDSPLVVKNETGGREVDSMLMKSAINGRFLKLYATSRTYMLKSFKHIRGEELCRGLTKNKKFVLGKNLVETFPTGIFLSLFPDIFDDRYKLSSKHSLEELKANAKQLINEIEKLGFNNIQIDLTNVATKLEYKHREDQIDALLCGINSYYFYHKKTEIYQCDDNGVTALPKI